MGDKYIKGLETVIQQFTVYFADRYFGNDAEVEWVADEVGGVCNIGDYYFSFNDMMDYVRHKYTRKQLFEYYEYSLNEMTDGIHPISISNWKKLSTTSTR